MLAFGGVADGFVPFDAPTGTPTGTPTDTPSSSSSHCNQAGDENQFELELASIVMKAVQVPSPHALSRSKLKVGS